MQQKYNLEQNEDKWNSRKLRMIRLENRKKENTARIRMREIQNDLQLIRVRNKKEQQIHLKKKKKKKTNDLLEKSFSNVKITLSLLALEKYQI